MSADHTKLIFSNHANVGTFFWATVDVHVLSGMAMIMIATPTNATHLRRLYKEIKARVIWAVQEWEHKHKFILKILPEVVLKLPWVHMYKNPVVEWHPQTWGWWYLLKYQHKGLRIWELHSPGWHKHGHTKKDFIEARAFHLLEMKSAPHNTRKFTKQRTHPPAAPFALYFSLS